MYISILVLFLLVITAIAILKHPKFGRQATGERLAAIKESLHFKEGAFQNESDTPALTEGASYWVVAKEAFFGKPATVRPLGKIPSIKTDLLQLDINEDVLIWFGHSSYFIQIDQKRILVDPVFCGHASPFSFSIKAFNGADIYSPDDIPDIDYLFITHDHWDHLDYDTVKELKPRVKQVICGLGTGEHLEYWGFDAKHIIEKDWNETIHLEDGFTVHTVPGRHFSGRMFRRNQSVWTSFVLQTPTIKLFLGGDSGYDTHFLKAGEKFGPFDLAILENGQYNKFWKYIHMMPEEVLQAAVDLKAKRLLTVHHAKFALANHSWDEPLTAITALNKNNQIPLITPMIGEKVNLKDPAQKFSEWWKLDK